MQKNYPIIVIILLKNLLLYDYRFSKQESIELIQNFCSWLNDSNYSGLKILKISK